MDLRSVDNLVDFVRGPGYVLDFSDRTYSQFFATEIAADIDDPIYSTRGGSKGSRSTGASCSTARHDSDQSGCYRYLFCRKLPVSKRPKLGSCHPSARK